VTLASILAAAPALAVRTPRSVSPGGLEAAPGMPRLRAETQVDWGNPPRARRGAWNAFLADAGGRWWATWDSGSAVPARIFGRGVAAPGSVGDAAVAEAHARAFLVRHAGLFAPGVGSPATGTPVGPPATGTAVGASVADAFTLVANDLDADMRTVAFAQLARAGGDSLPVVGAAVSFRYRNDRLFVIASSAVPAAAVTAAAIDAAAAGATAGQWVQAQHGEVSLGGAPRLVVLPMRRPSSIDARTAWEVVVEAEAPRARYRVYVDARSGRALAREQMLRFAGGTVRFDVPLRGPEERIILPAPFVNLTVDGVVAQSDEAGAFTWSTAVDAQLSVTPSGKLVDILNYSGDETSLALTVADGGDALWSAAGDETGDAQLSGFIHANVAKAHARTIAPELAFLDKALAVRVNKDEPEYYCNAYWDGTATNFVREAGPCNNSARVADIVYHEFGHALHQYAIIPGTGAYDSALSEGASDYLSATITDDPVIAPEFYVGGGALREIETDRRWPEDISSWDTHETGLIFAGAMWDLRKALVDSEGAVLGAAVADHLYYQALRRSTDIPATYIEALAADDDDGDLDNGTPHVCAITAAFLRHGLAGTVTPSGLRTEHEALGAEHAGMPLTIRVRGEERWPECGDVAITMDAVIRRRDGVFDGETVALEREGDEWVGQLGPQPQGSAWSYEIRIAAGDGEMWLPDNRADPEYRFFVGETTPLYCTDFEEQPTDWVTGDLKGGLGDFAWGAPAGVAGDPAAAFSGDKVFGNDLGDDDGLYQRRKHPYLDSPVVSLGADKQIRLQYRRWLTVDDGALDHARVLLNGAELWENPATDENDGSLDLRDHEWRFEDYDLSFALAYADTAQLRFELEADASLQLGGWNVDDVCIVTWKSAPPVEPEEPADDDGAPMSPPGADAGCGCRSAPAGPAPGGAAALGVLLAAACLRLQARRRRARATAR
jgi:MYXO-CTERM domain-containing protein